MFVINSYLGVFQHALIRDTVIVIGTDTLPPATAGIFYCDLSSPHAGGTGHTISVCEENDIPVVDQRAWFEWG